MRSVFFLATIMICVTASAQHGHKGSGVTSLDICSEGSSIHLLLARQEGDAPASLYYLRSGDRGANFISPVKVGEGQLSPTVKRGADARITAFGDHLIAVWTTRNPADRFERGPLATAISSDGGRTWSAGSNPSDNACSTGHAFIAITVDGEGVFHLVWLDARTDPTLPDAKSGKGLRYSQSRDFGKTWSKNSTLDPATCECCWNTIIASSGIIRVLYRDRDPRDMAMVMSADGGQSWSTPVTVGDFKWSVDACPHTGGALAAVGSTVLSAVWTGNGSASGAYLLRSDDGGSTWTSPARLGDESSWHTDATVNARGRLAIVWDAEIPDAQGVYAMTSMDQGRTWTSPVLLSDPKLSATHPRVIAVQSGFRVFWTQSSGDAPSTWRSAEVE